MRKDIRLGIDLGGTKTEIIALNDSGEEILRQRRPSPKGDYNATLRNIADMVKATATTLGLGKHHPVGLGIPGAVSPASGLIKNANSTWLIGHAMDRDLSTLLDRPVRLANDADCFTLSEAVDGAGRGMACVFGVILGTGVGGGIVVHQKLLNGPNAIVGEWGHNPLPQFNMGFDMGLDNNEKLQPALCYCGKYGCIETYLSGPGLSADHLRHTGNSLKATEIAALAENLDGPARATLARYTNHLARALASIINVLDPDVIVLGGGLSTLSQLYTDVPRQWGNYVFSDVVNTRLLPPKHGDSSGVRGAAWLWPQAL